MHILHLIDSEGFYGAERVVLGLAQESTSHGHRVSIGMLAAPNEHNAGFEAAARQQQLPIAHLALGRGISVSGTRRILDFARTENVDVIHSHSYKPNILLGCVPRNRRPYPVVATMHGRTSARRLRRLLVYQYVERLMIRRLEAVVFVDQHSMERARGFVHSGKSHYVPNGIDCRRVQDWSSSDTGRGTDTDAPRDAMTLLAIGRLSHEKGFDLLLSALRDLHNAGHAVDLVIAGEGAERSRLLAQARELDLLQYLEMPGYKSDLSPLLRKTGALVIPSRSEGLPLVLLEAMASGVPVIATAVGEIPVVLDHGRVGTLIEPDSVQAIVSGVIEHLTAAESVARRAAAAMDRVHTTYSSEVMALRYDDIYRAIADKA